jgi:hypothetical protein
VGALRNWIVAGFQTICNMPGIWDHLQVAMRYQARACTQARGGHMEYFM